MYKALLTSLLLTCAIPTMAQQKHNIDLLVVYTKVTGDAILQPDLDKYIEAPIAPANEVFVNNDLPARIRLVGTEQVPYIERGGVNTAYDLAWLSKDPGVAALRDKYGADVVLMVTTLSGPCGLAGGIPKGGTGNLSAYGFGLVRSDCWPTPYVVLHEIGHILGLSHNIEADATSSYDTGHAYIAPDQSWFTVVAQNNPEGTIPYFSSATRLYQGKPLGNSLKSDAEGVLRQTIPIVSGFRPEKVQPGC